FRISSAAWTRSRTKRRVSAIPSSTTADVLILTPYGRDAAVAGALLREAGITPFRVCEDLHALERALGDAAWFVIVAEEVLQRADLQAISRFVAAQPPWSDLPFIVLTQRGGG